MPYHRSTTPINELPLLALLEPEPEPDFAPLHQAPAAGKLAQDGQRLLAHMERHGAYGKDKAITGNELVARLGLGGTNMLRAVVGALRKDGYLICSSIAHGYYLASGPQDVDDTIRDNYMNRLSEMAETCNLMINRARSLYGEPANQIMAVRVDRVEHRELPERYHA